MKREIGVNVFFLYNLSQIKNLERCQIIILIERRKINKERGGKVW